MASYWNTKLIWLWIFTYISLSIWISAAPLKWPKEIIRAHLSIKLHSSHWASKSAVKTLIHILNILNQFNTYFLQFPYTGTSCILLSVQLQVDIHTCRQIRRFFYRYILKRNIQHFENTVIFNVYYRLFGELSNKLRQVVSHLHVLSSTCLQ